MREERKLFKDYFDRAAAQTLAKQVANVDKRFDERAFCRRACKDLEKLEMMARVRQWSAALREGLCDDVAGALVVLERSLPPELPDGEAVTDGFLQWPVGQFIADYGLEAPDEAFSAMEELTKRFSSEFAIRPFVEHQPGRTFKACARWARSDNVHLRRLASEGIRPRLPWGAVLTDLVRDPSPILPVLERLKDDSEDYVRRSVANNLNDIGKDHPALLLETCKRWQKDATPERRWVIRHALRSLVKKGEPKALRILGYSPAKSLSTKLRVSPERLRISEKLALELEVTNQHTRAQRLMIDFRIHYVGKGALRKPKVFKWKDVTLSEGAVLQCTKQVTMAQRTTRSLYPGQHTVDIQINGQVVAHATFVLR